MILTQLRCSASFLNSDLFHANIITDPKCRCGYSNEDATHFLLHCPLYLENRGVLLNDLRWLPDNIQVNTVLLTCGHCDLDHNQNIDIFKHVYEFIKRTGRFHIV